MEDFEIIKRRIRTRMEVINRVKRYAESLIGKYSIFLIGSYARGDFNAWSDIDIVIIGDFQGNPIERLLLFNAPPGFDIIPLTKGELLAKVKKRDPLTMDLVKHGIAVRDDLGLCGELGIINCALNPHSPT